MRDASELLSGHANASWLPERTILLTLHGSRSYGTSTAESDEDYKGIAVPPARYFHGFTQSFEQAEGHDPDLIVYDVRKFCRLAANANPTILEVLYTDDADLLRLTPAGALLRRHRDAFLSRRARATFAEYALSQLKRIWTHRRWLLSPPEHKPTREEHGLPESSLLPANQRAAIEERVRARMATWEVPWERLDPPTVLAVRGQIERWLADVETAAGLDQWEAAARLEGVSPSLIEVCRRERAFRAALEEWRKYEAWRARRNPARAALESAYGYDCKHAMHLVRLLRMCQEVLERGEVLVRRPDAAELLAIRNGAWSYDQVIDFAQSTAARCLELERTSALPDQPDMDRLDALCMDVIGTS